MQKTPDPKDARQPLASRQDPLLDLDRSLDTFEASRRKPSPVTGMGGAAGDGYRVLGQMLGGVLGGVGLGWLFDHFAHTGPLGLLGGLLIGTGLSIYAAVQTASRMGAKTETKRRPQAAGDDDDVT